MAAIIRTEAKFIEGGKRPFKSVSHKSEGKPYVAHFASKAAAVAHAQGFAKHWGVEFSDNVWEPTGETLDEIIARDRAAKAA